MTTPSASRRLRDVPCDWPGEERPVHRFEMEHGRRQDRFGCTVAEGGCGNEAVVKCNACGHGWCVDHIPDGRVTQAERSLGRRR